MTEYVHHVPGRLRVRSKVFRCDSGSRSSMLRKLRTLEGVHDVRLNAKAGSVTVCYDSETAEPARLMDVMRECRCVETAPVRRRRTTRRATADENMTKIIGRMALNVLVSKGVNYSLGLISGARA